MNTLEIMNSTLVLDTLAVLVIVVYHARLACAVRRRPATTTIGSNRLARERWVERVMSQGLDLLAVQTLRNWTMAATFLASTAIVVALGALHLLTTGSNNSGDLGSALDLSIAAATPNSAKGLLVALILFAAFFHFTQTLRNFNHAAFLLTTPDCHDSMNVARVVSRGASHYTFGMRAYYFVIPISLWLFGSLAFLGSSIAIVLILWRIDYTVN